ncbi:hypothetical protein DFH09DRAFT_1277572 [Mycena vulgaris]|nr:hypothetical protein DFH09DRAFT_1277572 [Mycena vulgaris]
MLPVPGFYLGAPLSGIRFRRITNDRRLDFASAATPVVYATPKTLENHYLRTHMDLHDSPLEQPPHPHLSNKSDLPSTIRYDRDPTGAKISILRTLVTLRHLCSISAPILIRRGAEISPNENASHKIQDSHMREVSAEKTSLRWREPLPKVLAGENIRRLHIYFQVFWSKLGPGKRWCLFTLSTEKEDTASKRTEPAKDTGRFWSDARSSASRSPAQSSSHTSEYYAPLQHPPSSMEFPLNIYLPPEWDALLFDAPQANPGFPYVDSGTAPACSNPLDLSEYSVITNSGPPASDTITLPSLPNLVQLSLDSGLHRAAEPLAGEVNSQNRCSRILEVSSEKRPVIRHRRHLPAQNVLSPSPENCKTESSTRTVHSLRARNLQRHGNDNGNGNDCRCYRGNASCFKVPQLVKDIELDPASWFLGEAQANYEFGKTSSFKKRMLTRDKR